MSSCINNQANTVAFILKGPPGETLLPNRLGPFDQDAEKNDWSLLRLRRSVDKLEENIPPSSVGSQLIHILEYMSKQLNEITLRTGLERDHPFQSCLDLHDRSKSGRTFLQINLKYFNSFRKILD